ncbi:MAG: hypothetical protein GX410_01505 [Elusimicrobia bacterium]|nr:hypothetical protein [Elusimicrobiota bacterium]
MAALVRIAAWIVWLAWGAGSAYLAYDINRSVGNHSSRWAWFIMILVAFAGVTLVTFLLAQVRGNEDDEATE